MKIYVRTVFDKHFADVKIDQNLCRRIIDHTLRFMNKNEDHIEFFGGVFIGVVPFKFTEDDREAFFDDVVFIDKDLLDHDHKKNPFFDGGDYHTLSDSYNFLAPYLSMRIETTKGIPDRLKREAQICLFIMLHSKFMGSLQFQYFNKFNATRPLMEETFMRLNYKFDIKALGSWENLFRDRAISVIERNKDFRKVITDSYGGNLELEQTWTMRIVTDLQSRLRALYKLYYQVYIDVRNSGSKITTIDATIKNADKEDILKDQTTGYSNYLSYIKDIVPDQTSFIRVELIRMVEELLPNIHSAHFVRSLEYMSKNYNYEYKIINEFVENSVIYVFNTLQANKTSINRTNDLKATIEIIKSKLMAPKNREPEIIIVRELGEKIANTATGIRNPAILSTIRSGLMLYVALRTMTKSHYSR